MLFIKLTPPISVCAREGYDQGQLQSIASSWIVPLEFNLNPTKRLDQNQPYSPCCLKHPPNHLRSHLKSTSQLAKIRLAFMPFSSKSILTHCLISSSTYAQSPFFITTCISVQYQAPALPHSFRLAARSRFIFGACMCFFFFSFHDFGMTRHPSRMQ